MPNAENPSTNDLSLSMLLDSRSHSTTQNSLELKLSTELYLLAGEEMMEDSSPHEEVIEVSGFDILLGRHKYCFHHSGNRSFRTLIASNLEWYASLSTKREKSAVSSFLLKLIRSGGGRFLKEGPSFHQWYEVDDKVAREKISHALRDQGNQRTFRNASKISRNKKYTNEHSDPQDRMMSHPHAYIDETKGSQQHHFVVPVPPPDYWRSLVFETLEESMNAFKAGEAKNAASYNLESGTRQHDLDRIQPGSNDKPNEAWLDTILSDAWLAQRAATLEPMSLETSASSLRGATAHHSDSRAREVGLDGSFVPHNEYVSLDNDYLVRQTIQESLRVSKVAEEATNANAFNLKRGARHGLAQPGSNVELNKSPESNIFVDKCHDFIKSSTWPVQRTSILKRIGGETSAFDSTDATKRHPASRAMECSQPDWNFVLQNEHPSLDSALMANSRRYSVLKPYRTSLKVSKVANAERTNTSDRNRRHDDVTRLGSDFELEHMSNTNIFEQQGYDTHMVPTIPSYVWVTQHASIVTRTDETRDIISPSTTTNHRNSRDVPLKPRVVATTQWSPYAYVEPRYVSSLRRLSLGDTSFDNSIEAYSTALKSPFEDLGPLPLADDSQASFDIAKISGQSSLAHRANACSRVDDHDDRYTDPQLDAMLLELDKCRPGQGGCSDTEVDDHDDKDEIMEDPHEWAAPQELDGTNQACLNKIFTDTDAVLLYLSGRRADWLRSP